MQTQPISRPQEDELPSGMQHYVAGLEGEDLLPTLREQMPDLDRRLAGLPDEKALHRYGEGKWSVKELLVHVTDAERVFGYRMMCIARGEEAPLPAFDENGYAAHSNADRRPLAGILEELRGLRQALIALIESLDDEALDRRGVANTRVVSARAAGWIAAGHFAHHARILKERYGV